ncbi:MAG: lasso peptide biosynthesis PqqD family chaperone [Gammaproteobacteria bacterium]
MASFDTDSLYIRNPDMIATDMDGDTVMMSIERGDYYGLADVASRVWEWLDEPLTCADIVKRVCAEYEVDEAVCSADVRAFMQQMLEHGLVAPKR